MNKKNILPHQAQPVVRVIQGTQTDLLAELSEEVLGATMGASAGRLTPKTCSSLFLWEVGLCSYGDNAE